MSSTLQSKIEATLRAADRAAQEWVDENKSSIEIKIHEILDRKLTEIVCKLLGFDGWFGELSIDHCNGRAGESAAGDWLRAVAGDAVKTWLTEQAGDLPNLPAKSIASLRKSYLEAFEDTLRDALRDKAIEDAQAAISEHLKAITGS